MLLKTILNRIENHSSSFIFQNERLFCDDDGSLRIEIDIRPRVNGRPVCSGCGRHAPGYDRLAERRFEFIPLWQIPVFFVYVMRRVACRRCGVKVEAVPWSDSKSPITRTFAWFLSTWATRLSWEEVARIFGVSWQTVREAVARAVEWGREHLDLSNVNSVGVDELQCERGSKQRGAGAGFATLVYQLDPDRKRLLWVARDRNETSFADFFEWLGAERTGLIRSVCSDMWRPYLKVIREKLPHATHVLDRFHIMKNFNKAIDDIRAAEAKELRRQGLAILINARWILLKKRENLNEHQATRLRELLRHNLKVVRAYLLREEFQKFWTYKSHLWAGRFLDSWCRRAIASRIDQMKKVAKTLLNHRELILNWFHAKHLSSGAVEGLNNKANVVVRRSYGFRTFANYQLALYHSLGALPKPVFTHRF